VRGQKSVDNQRSETKIKTSKKYFLNFSLGSTELIILEFLTPHGSKIATTVAILSPALPQGESYNTESVESIAEN
jgi:hypothetical protein